jgi:hypothetical protein
VTCGGCVWGALLAARRVEQHAPGVCIMRITHWQRPLARCREQRATFTVRRNSPNSAERDQTGVGADLLKQRIKI